MFRKVLCSLVILGAAVGLAMGDEFTAVITKVKDGKVSFTKFDRKTKEKTEGSLEAASNVKVVKGKFNKETKKFEAGEAIEEGLKNKMFTDIEKGVFARIVTDDDGKKITEIRVMQFGKKGKKKSSDSN